MTNERTRRAQFEVLVSYMEQHGDIHWVLDRIEAHMKWVELAKLLNNKALGEPKPTGKWKKVWSDFKNNSKKKELRIKRKHCKTTLTELEKRVLKLVRNQKLLKRKTPELDDENTIEFKAETEHEEDPFQTPPHSSVNDINCNVTSHRKSSTSSTASISSHEETPTLRTTGKNLEEGITERNLEDSITEKNLEDRIQDVAEKYLEFEKERERLAHEREMARIRQNDQLILIFGKIVNVLETLTPNIQRCLDRNSNDNG